MKKFNLVLKNLVLVHELEHVDEIGGLIANAANGYGFSYFGLFHRYFPNNDDVPRWQSLIDHLNLRPLFDAGEDANRWFDEGWSCLSSGDEPFHWQAMLDTARRENPVIYRRLKTVFEQAKAAGIGHGITFPVFTRSGLLGKMSLGSDGPVELSPVEISLFWILAVQSLRRCVSILQRSENRSVVQRSVPSLSDRELVILQCIASGRTSQEIGKAVGISPYTVNWYVNGLQRKLVARNRQNLIALAFRLGLVR